MRSIFKGSIVAALAMFLVGCVFYGTSLKTIGLANASLDAQDTVHSALKALPKSGTYLISAWRQDATDPMFPGPFAVVKYNNVGNFSPYDATTCIPGLAHMFVSAFLLGLVLWTARNGLVDFGARLRLVLWLSLAMTVFTRLGEPIWYHTDWRNALYVAVADFLSFAVAGAILARWFVKPAEA